MHMPTSQQQPLELLDIYDVSYNPWWLNKWLWYTSYGLLAMLVLVGVYFLVRSYMPKKRVPYWQQATHAIGQLSYSFDDPKLFYVQLTDILKRCLQERYALPLVGKTDTELLAALEHDNVVSVHVYEQLQEILHGVVYIKFAHHDAALEQMKQAQKTALAIIYETHDSLEKV